MGTDTHIHLSTGPDFHRHKFRKNSHLSWGEYGLSGEEEGWLREHMMPAGASLRMMFAFFRPILPRKSELCTGGAHGSWIYCPNDIADVVEHIIKAQQVTFRLRK